MTLPIEYSEDEVRITGATATSHGAILLAEGIYHLGDGFNGNIALTIDDSEMLRRTVGLPLEGELALAGDLTYTAGDGITFTGETYVSDGRFASMSVPNLSARLTYNNDGLRIWDLRGFMGGGEIVADLTIPLVSENGCGEVGSFAVSGLNIGQLLPPEYSQVISTSLDVSGDVDYNPQERVLNFDMWIAEEIARVGTNVISTDDEGLSVRIALALREGENVSIEIVGVMNSRPAGAPIYYGRELTPYSSRVIDEITEHLTGRFREEAPGELPEIPAVTGTFDIRVNLANLLGETNGVLDIASENFEIFQVEFSSVDLHLDNSEGGTWDVDLHVAAEELGKFEINGEIVRGEKLADSTIELTAAIHDSGLDTLLGFMGFADVERTSGSVGGSGIISGSFNDPVMENFRLTLGESVVFGIPINQGVANFSYDSPVLNLTEFEMVGQDGFRALGAGSMDLSSISLMAASYVLRVDELDLQVISTGWKASPASGILSGTIELRQDALGPKTIYDISVDDMSLLRGDGSIRLGNLTMSAKTRPGDEQVNIESLDLVREEERINISGHFPVNLKNSSAELIDLEIKCDTGYGLPMPLGVVSPKVAWEGGIGPSHINITGSIDEPRITGELELGIKDVQYYETVLIQGIEGTLTCDNSIIAASPEDLLIRGDGWEFGLDGQANIAPLFKGNETSARIAVVPSTEGSMKLGIEGVEFHLQPGIGSDALTLDLQGSSLSNLTATIGGDIDIVGGSVDFANLPEFSSPTESEDLGGFVFDLRVELLAGLRVQNGDKYNFVFESGSLHLTGPIDRPALTGSILAPTGWIDISGNHFVLIEPIEFIFSSLYPPTDPRVKATAQTHLRDVHSPAYYGQELTITATIDDRLSNMMGNIKWSSDPPLNEDQLIAALLHEDIIFRTGINILSGDNPMDPGFENIDLTNMVLPFATSYLSRQIRKEAGFVDFELSFDRYQNIFIYVEKEVFDDMMMYYSQTFGPDAEDDYLWGARYRWRPRSWIGFEVDNDEEITPQIQYIIPID